MKKLFILLLALALLCASGTTMAEGRGYRIALCNNSMSVTWRYQMVAEFEQAAEALKESGVLSEYYESNANLDASKQIADMRNFVDSGVDGILIAVVNDSALNQAIEEATDAGVKVVAFNALPTTDHLVAKVNQSNEDFGRIGAEFLVNALNGEGKIIVLQGIAGDPVCADRWKGAKAVFDRYPGIEFVGEAYGNWNYADGKAATESLLSANPQIDGVWSQGGAMSQGALDAFVEAGRALVPMSGESGNGFMAAWKKYIGVDRFDSVAPVYDCAMVVDALNVLIDALDGKEVEFDQSHMDMEIITSDNIDDYYRADLPDSYWAGTRLSEENLAKLFKSDQ